MRVDLVPCKERKSRDFEGSRAVDATQYRGCIRNHGQGWGLAEGLVMAEVGRFRERGHRVNETARVTTACA